MTFTVFITVSISPHIFFFSHAPPPLSKTQIDSLQRKLLTFMERTIDVSVPNERLIHHYPMSLLGLHHKRKSWFTPGVKRLQLTGVFYSWSAIDIASNPSDRTQTQGVLLYTHACTHTQTDSRTHTQTDAHTHTWEETIASHLQALCKLVESGNQQLVWLLITS